MKSLKKIQRIMLIVLVTLISLAVLGQTDIISKKKTVFIDITTFTDTSVSFSWSNYETINSTSIYRKELSGSTWTLLYTTTNTSYTDNTIATNKEYEYQFKATRLTAPTEVYGYVAFGTKVDKKSTRGNMLIVLDTRFSSSLSNEIRSLQLDLIGDGWNTILISCDTSETPNFLKSKIDSVNSDSPLNGVILIGHLPVPYSGDNYIDGHYDHRGAWPTDLYYVTNERLWTDNKVMYSNSDRPINSNLTRDGKFDNSSVPEKIFAPISRIDFANLPLLNKTEVDLLKNYLSELSKYKHAQNIPIHKGVIENNFSAISEGFGYNGYMNFSSLMQSSNVVEADVINSLSTNFYQWSYAAGGGTDTSASGVLSISQIPNLNYKGVFSMLFGSYFGDWNTNNNLLRAYLADGKMLSTCWAGRPTWFFHNMGTNNYLGLSALRTINNGLSGSTLYEPVGLGSNLVHISLMGDMSLRNKYATPVNNFTGSYNKDDNKVYLEWNSLASHAVTSYDLYIASDTFGPYNLLVSVGASNTSYNYTPTTSDTLYYQIKAIYLDTTPNGSYYNNTIGSFIAIDASDSTTTSVALPVELMHFSGKQMQNSVVLNWTTAQEINVNNFEIEKSLDAINWEQIGKQAGRNLTSVSNYTFNDYSLNFGNNYYRLKIVDFDNSFEYSEVVVINNQAMDYIVYPNPTKDGQVFFKSSIKKFDFNKNEISVTDVFGKQVDFEVNESLQSIKIHARPGVYQLFYLGKYQQVIIVN